MNNSYNNLITKLPLTLADKAFVYSSPVTSAGASPRPSRPISPDLSVRGVGGRYNVSPEMVLEAAESGGYRDEEEPPRFSDVGGTGKAPTYRDVEDVNDVEQQRQRQPQLQRPSAQFDPDQMRNNNMTPTSRSYSNEHEIGEDGDREEEEPKDFFHPAVVGEQWVIWIPNDESCGMRIAEREVEACEREGVRATCKGANVDWSGQVRVGGEVPE